MDKSKIIGRTSQFILKYKFEIFVMILMLVLTSALSVLAPYVSNGFYYDEVLNTAGQFYGEIILVLIIIISTRIFSTIVNMFHNIVTSIIAAKVVEVVGTKIDIPRWKAAKKEIRELINANSSEPCLD
jgi:ABC-type multidrug transport system fused ATPase/permease subunit